MHDDSMTNEESGRAEAEVVAETAEGTVAVAPDDAAERGSAVALAGLHLRLGSLALARAELETLAGRGALDAAARVDLAEVRWRTGDLVGGGEAAREALAGGGDSVVALVVAAEAASALGRPSEARRLAGQALTLNEGPIDPVFAGMPRSSVWPGDPAEPLPSATTLFPPERVDSVIDADREGAALTAADDRKLLAALEAEADAVAAEAAPSPGEPGLWDLHEAATVAATATAEPPGPPELEPSALFDGGRAALEAGDPATAAIHLGLVVRLAPALAPAVLSVIGEANDAGLLLVQGDAYRAVGHETEARRAYAAARVAATTTTTASSAEPTAEAQPVVAPFAAPAETGLWWLEPKREAESESLAEPESGAEPSAELGTLPRPTSSRPPSLEPPPNPSRPPHPEPRTREPSRNPRRARNPSRVRAVGRTRAGTPAEPEPDDEPQPPAEPEPQGEPERRTDDTERRDDAGQWRNDG